MALDRLQSLVVSVAASATDNATGLVRKSSAMRFPAFLSYPRHLSPSYQAEPDTRSGQGGAVNIGTAQAVTRAGRPGCWAGVPCQHLARKARGTIHSRMHLKGMHLKRWSRLLVKPATVRGLAKSRMANKLFGIARQG